MATDVSARSTKRMIITLSREELYVTMRLIKAKQLPGFSLDWLNTAPDGTISDEVQQTLAVAANGLVARGYLFPGKMPTGSEPLTVSMPSPLIALVGTAAFSDYTILLSLQRTSDGPLMLYLHGFHELGVIHSMPFAGIHQFEAVEGQANMERVINDVLHLGSQLSSKLPTGDVPVTAMESAREAAARGKLTLAQERLLSGGLPAEIANALAKAMVNASVMGAVIIGSRNADKQVDHMVGAVVVGPETCFLITDKEAASSTLHVQSISADALRERISVYMHIS